MSLLERTLSEIAKPKWEGSPTFSGSWDGLRLVAQNLRMPQDTRRWACGLLVPMATARVLVVDRSQVEALPAITDSDQRSVAEHVAMPFEQIYLDLGVAEAAGASTVGVQAAGCLLFSAPQDRLPHLVVFAWNASERIGVPFVLSLLGNMAEGHGRSITYTEMVTGKKPSKEATVRDIGEHLNERALAVLQWLESVNVEIVDRPVSRQVRRNAERKGAQIAKVVRVKLPRSYRHGAQPHNGSVEFSHRFEVRGHYKLFPDSTRLAQAAPEKLSWVPERDGYFRRVWCPPFVKGPIDKPLVPKSRLLIGEAA